MSLPLLPHPIRSAWSVALLFMTGLGSFPRLAGALDAPPPKLEGFDTTMQQLVRDWNVPGIGVGVVVHHQLVFAKGYGYRDYGRKLPFTEHTVVPIASNTKLFTAVAAGLLVEEGKLDWDQPVRQFVPSIEFHDDEAWLSRSELVAAGYALSRPDGSRIDPDGARAYHVIARPE